MGAETLTLTGKGRIFRQTVRAEAEIEGEHGVEYQPQIQPLEQQ
jgi:hypothetical protein